MRLAFSILALLIAFAASTVANAQGLSREEQARVAAGEVVRRPIDVELGGESYFGGIAHAIVDAPVEEVLAALLDAGTYREILPLTLEATPAGRRGDDSLVFLRQGGRFGTADYTMTVHRHSPTVVRFWLDTTRPHNVEDCWGYFRVEPVEGRKTLLTYAALLNLEPGLIRLLFTEKIRGWALDTPLWVRRYVEGRRPATR